MKEFTRIMNSKRLLLNTLVGGLAFLVAMATEANPVLDNVAHGQVTFESAPSTLTINQASDKAIINWQSFNIGAAEATHFNQPTGGVAFNRINAMNGASQIYGSLSATGQIILVNPAGIHFGPNAHVNVGGLIASTGNLSDESFLSGQYNFTNAGSGFISNQGEIIAANNGLVALLGNNVSNEGLIQANLGKVVLASGDAFTISFGGNDLISFAVNDSPKSVSNTGTLRANGGQIIVSAKTASGVLDNVINMAGIAEAKSVGTQNGEIILDGGTSGVVAVKGKLIASGKNSGESGGHVQITGHNILIDDTAEIDVSGNAGGGSVEIGGNYQGIGPLQHANAIYMAPNAIINADAITSGNGGNIVLWSDNSTRAYGSLYARGGLLGGSGGLIETSGHQYLSVNGIRVDTSAVNGSTGRWLLDPANLAITNTDFNVTGASPFEPTGAGSTVSAATLETALASNFVTVQTGNDAVAENGDINVNADITWTSGFALTLRAAGNIFINAAINSSAAELALQAGAAGTSTNTITYGGGSIRTPQLRIIGGTALDFNNTNTTIPGGNLITSAGTTFAPNGDFSVFNIATINGTLAPSANMTFDAGIFQISGDITATNSPTLRLYEYNSGSLVSGIISGVSSLIVESLHSNQVVTFTGANTYTGTTTINNSVLQIGNGGTAGNLGSGNVINNSTLRFNHSDNITVANDISGVGALSQAGTGITTLSGNNTYGGTTTISQGTLQLGVDNAIPSTSAVTLADVAGATLDLNNFNLTIGSLAGGGALGGNVTLGSGTLTTGDNGTDTVFSGIISGSGSLVKSGSGILELDGINTYSGGTSFSAPTLIAGTLRVGNNDALGTGTLTVVNSNIANLEASQNNIVLSNPVAIENGARLNIQGANNLELSGDISMQLFFSSLYNYNSAKTVLSGLIDSNFSTSSSIHQEGPGELELVNSNNGPVVPFFPNYSGSIILNAGTLTADSGFAMGRGTLFYNGGQFQVLNDSGSFFNMVLASTLTYNSARLSMRGNVSGSGGLIINGGGISLGGFSSFTGGAIINGGFLEASNGDVGTGSITVNAGGSLSVFSTSISNAVILNGGTLDGSSNGTQPSVLGPITLLADSTITSGQGGITTFNINGPIDGAQALTLAGPGVFSLNSTIGGTTPLTSLTTTASEIQLNNASIFTTGDQQYNNPLYQTAIIAMPGTTNNLNLVGNANANINFAYGAVGGGDLILIGNTGDNAFTISNAMLLNNFTATGNGGIDTLTLNIPNAQTWNVTSANTGTIAGSAITGTGLFSDISNIVSGSGNDTFNFLGTGSQSGSLDVASGNDTVNYASYTSPISVLMSDASAGTAYASDQLVNGTINPAFRITSFSNLENVIGNNGGYFTVPASTPSKNFSIVFLSQTPFDSTRFSGSGFVVDPINFAQFLFFFNNPTPNVNFVLNPNILYVFNTDYVYTPNRFPNLIDIYALDFPPFITIDLGC